LRATLGNLFFPASVPFLLRAQSAVAHVRVQQGQRDSRRVWVRVSAGGIQRTCS
jgi:hypothetical protein